MTRAEEPSIDQSDVETAATDEKPDAKAVFQAALAKKKAAGTSRSQHLDGDNHVTGSSHSAGGKRMFRRKSGS